MLQLGARYLLHGYRQRLFTPSVISRQMLEKIEATEQSNNVWIHRVPSEQILERAEYLDALFNDTAASPSSIEQLFTQYPLYGIPFAIKDNIDVAGMPTTCACPGYQYIAKETAECVQHALSAGAILVGKTNLDQFATGLNGTRSPYGTPTNAYNTKLCPGGSSSGSAVAVASDLVSFSLGTDTAGSGRVPAALNNIYGIKPSRDIISTHGVVPACKSLDCVSIFTQSVSDAFIVMNAVKNPSQSLYHTVPTLRNTEYEHVHDRDENMYKYGIPKGILDKANVDKYFCGDMEYYEAFKTTIQKQLNKHGKCIEIDFDPFFQVAQLLYNGPWVTERLCALPFMSDKTACQSMQGLDPTVHKIISGSSTITAKTCFDSFYKLDEYKQLIQRKIWNELRLDFLCVPSIPTTYSVDEMKSNPIELNSNLGLYTNFVNLLNMSAVAMPCDLILDFEAESCCEYDNRPRGRRVKSPQEMDDDDVRPFGVTLIGQDKHDYNLMLYAMMIESDKEEMETEYDALCKRYETVYKLCVCGAHMLGGVLNHELTSRGAHLLKRVKSKRNMYEMYAIDGGKKPGLVRIENDKDVEIEMEIWSFDRAEKYADFIAHCVKPPLCVGSVVLNDDTECKGFLMESYGIRKDGKHENPNITVCGGWKNYQKSVSSKL